MNHALFFLFMLFSIPLITMERQKSLSELLRQQLPRQQPAQFYPLVPLVVNSKIPACSETDQAQFEFLSHQISSQELKQRCPSLSPSEFFGLLAMKGQIEGNNLSSQELEAIKTWQEEMGTKHAELLKQLCKNKGSVPPLIRSGTEPFEIK